MGELSWILLATLLVSLTSFAGAVTLVLSEKLLRKLLLVLVGFAAGSLIGGAFLHLLPESIGSGFGTINTIFLVVLVGFILFFILEKFLWRHCHARACPVHAFVYLNLLGDGVHNFIDGLVIATSFLVSIPLGLVATLAVAAHEIPQELGDFGVLVYGGLRPRAALLLNFATALAAVAGGIAGYYLYPYAGDSMVFLLPFAAGGFLYIAASDLIPELHKETNPTRTVVSFFSFLLGVLLMLGIRIMFSG
jgi:zinc and cadmium transporter